MSEHRDKRDRETHDGTRPDKPPRRPGTHADDRDHARPKTSPFGIPTSPPPRGEFSFEEKTEVGADPAVAQVFHAVKELGRQFVENKSNAEKAHDALTVKIEGIATEVVEQGKGLARVVGYIDGQEAETKRQQAESDRRSKSPSSMMRIIQETSTTMLAGKIVEDQVEGRRFTRKLVLQIAGGIFSTATITAAITYAAGHC